MVRRPFYAVDDAARHSPPAQVSELTNCRNEKECERRGVPWELVQLYRKLRWCGQTIDLDRFAAKSFQGWDCWGKGRPPGPPQ